MEAQQQVPVPIENRFTALKPLVEQGLRKGYLLYEEVYDRLPDELMLQTDQLDEMLVRFRVLGVEVIDKPATFSNQGELDEQTEFDKPVQRKASAEESKSVDPVRLYLREMAAHCSPPSID